MVTRLLIGAILWGLAFVLPSLGAEQGLVPFLDKMFFPVGVVDAFLGKLPPHWPSSLPLPRDATLIGSLILRDGTSWAVVEVPWKLSQVEDSLATYVNQLESLGWTELPSESDESGGKDFCMQCVSKCLSPSYVRSAKVLKNTDGCYLLVMPSGGVAGEAVRLDILYSHPSRQVLMSLARFLLSESLPTIAVVGMIGKKVLPEFDFPPDKVTSVSEVPCLGENLIPEVFGTEVYEADLVATVDPEGLRDMVTERMRSAGWELKAQGASGPITWARYTGNVDSEEWEALLTIHTTGLPHTYHVSIHAFRAIAGG